MRSTPQRLFSLAICWIRAMVSEATLGRPPRLRDLNLQNSRKPWRCQRRSVSGLKMRMASFQCRTLLTRRTSQRRSVGAKLDATSVRIYDQGHLLAQHARSFGHHQVITIPEHQKRPWSVRKQPRPLEPSHLVPGLELPRQAALQVEQRDLSVYDALLAEEVAR